jgi:hypothetical protein
MRDPKKKCIAKKCDDCQFYQSWDMANKNGLRKSSMECSMQILFNEIPRLLGAIDGCQEAVNKTYNKVDAYGRASVETLKMIDNNIPKLLR